MLTNESLEVTHLDESFVKGGNSLLKDLGEKLEELVFYPNDDVCVTALLALSCCHYSGKRIGRIASLLADDRHGNLVFPEGEVSNNKAFVAMQTWRYLLDVLDLRKTFIFESLSQKINHWTMCLERGLDPDEERWIGEELKFRKLTTQEFEKKQREDKEETFEWARNDVGSCVCKIFFTNYIQIRRAQVYRDLDNIISYLCTSVDDAAKFAIIFSELDRAFSICEIPFGLVSNFFDCHISSCNLVRFDKP